MYVQVSSVHGMLIHNLLISVEFRLGQYFKVVMLGHDRSGYFSLIIFRSGYIWLSNVRSCYFR
jgi:hypothetical protein